MAYEPEFGEWVREHLAGLGSIELKRMFGFAAAKIGDRMFAIVDDSVIWLKADAELAADLEAAGARQFTYDTKAGETIPMAYWSLPDSAVDDPDEAVTWARRAVDVAMKAPAKRKRQRLTSPSPSGLSRGPMVKGAHERGRSAPPASLSGSGSSARNDGPSGQARG